LPAAREEVRAIAKQLPNANSTILIGPEATEAAFRLAARGKNVLHLATHGVINSDQPFESYLLLSGDGRTSANDGHLTAEEIYGLDLDADLVVLSACRTGTGSVGGEGIAHLARAFFYAGSSSMIVTLWDVEDKASSELLTRFYGNWLGSESKSASLRRAQLSLIKDLREGRIQSRTPAGVLMLPEHPFFWAGFILVGEP
jgi:CHAT domain-containing protein